MNFVHFTPTLSLFMSEILSLARARLRRNSSKSLSMLPGNTCCCVVNLQGASHERKFRGPVHLVLPKSLDYVMRLRMMSQRHARHADLLENAMFIQPNPKLKKQKYCSPPGLFPPFILSLVYLFSP